MGCCSCRRVYHRYLPGNRRRSLCDRIIHNALAWEGNFPWCTGENWWGTGQAFWLTGWWSSLGERRKMSFVSRSGMLLSMTRHRLMEMFPWGFIFLVGKKTAECHQEDWIYALPSRRKCPFAPTTSFPRPIRCYMATTFPQGPGHGDVGWNGR